MNGRRLLVGNLAILLCLPLLLTVVEALAGCHSTTDPREKEDAERTVKLDGSNATYDFGFVEPNTTHAAAFDIENPSPQLLVIRAVKAECACVTVTGQPKEIAPHSSARMHIDFTAPQKPADYSQRVVLLTAAADRGTIVINLKARIGLPLSLRPNPLDLGLIISGEHRLASISLHNEGKQPVKCLYSTSSMPSCNALIPRTDVAPGTELAIPILIRGPEGSRDPQKVSVCVYTDLAAQPRVVVPIRYRVTDKYRISSGMIDLGELRPGQEQQVQLEVSAGAPEAPQFVGSIEWAGVQNCSGKAKVAYAQGRAVISCQVTAGDNIGPATGMLRIPLAGMDRPVEVPVKGHVVGKAVAGKEVPGGGV